MKAKKIILIVLAIVGALAALYAIGVAVLSKVFGEDYYDEDDDWGDFDDYYDDDEDIFEDEWLCRMNLALETR